LTGVGYLLAPHLREDRNGTPKFCSGYIVEFGEQGRLAHIAEMLVGGLGEGEPIMPIT
jgi:hypothetical protein